MEAIRDGQRLAAATTLRPALVVQVVDPGSPIPPALWRRRIAEASSQVPAHVLFVLVSSSPAVRAVSTALAWLRPLTHEQSAVSTIGEAITLVENRRQGSGAVVERLHREVRAALRR